MRYVKKEINCCIKKKISKDTQFLLERLHVSREVAFHVYDIHGELITAVGSGNRKEDPLETDRKIYADLWGKWENDRYPVLMMESNRFIYFAFSDQEENFYIGGPICVDSVDDQHAMYEYRRKHNLPKSFLEMPKLSLMETANLLSLAIAMLNQQYVEELDLLEKNGLSPCENRKLEWDLSKYRMDSSESERVRVNYAYERKLLEIVRQGKVEAFENVSYDDLHVMDKIGKMAQNEGKQMEYMVAATITLVGRAAIEGGVPTDQSYALTDVFFQKLERCRDMISVINLSMEVQKAFTELVREYREQKKSIGYIEQCKELVAQSIHSHLSVEEIAKRIGINRTYLSTRFKEEVGMSISQYSVQVRLRASENMLKYSETSIAEIAEYLCFSSQSYFGKTFKDKNGMTPAEYRKRYQVVDFQE